MDDSVLILEQDHDGDGSELRLAVDPARWRCESAVRRARDASPQSAVLRATGGVERTLLRERSRRARSASDGRLGAVGERVDSPSASATPGFV